MSLIFLQIFSLVVIYFSETCNICPVRVWNLWNLAQTQRFSKINTKELVNCFHFQVIPLERIWGLHNIALGFDQLCWHNFRILVETNFSGISTEHNSRIIGLTLHIWRCGLGVVKVWLNLHHIVWQNIQTYGPMHARRCSYFSLWLLCPINFLSVLSNSISNWQEPSLSN